MRSIFMISAFLLSITGAFAQPRLGKVRFDVSHIRVYTSTINADGNQVPGQKPNTLNLVIDFKRRNMVFAPKQIYPFINVSQVDERGQWQSGKIVADIYQDEDFEYIVSIKDYNLEKYFSNFGKPSTWTLEDYKAEVIRLTTRRFWKLYLVADYEFKPSEIRVPEGREEIRQDIAKIPIHPDNFAESDVAVINLKFHLGDWQSIYHLEEIEPLIYLENKNSSSNIKDIPEVTFEKVDEHHYIASMGAVPLNKFFKAMNSGVAPVWNKEKYQQMILDLKEEWSFSVLADIVKDHEFPFEDDPLVN